MEEYMNYAQLSNTIHTAIEKYIKCHTPKPQVVEKVVEKQVDVPNDKVILSADIFSQIINILSVVENQGLIDKNILSEVYSDVKKNRTSLSNKKRKISTKDMFDALGIDADEFVQMLYPSMRKGEKK